MAERCLGASGEEHLTCPAGGDPHGSTCWPGVRRLGAQGRSGAFIARCPLGWLGLGQPSRRRTVTSTSIPDPRSSILSIERPDLNRLLPVTSSGPGSARASWQLGFSSPNPAAARLCLCTLREKAPQRSQVARPLLRCDAILDTLARRTLGPLGTLALVLCVVTASVSVPGIDRCRATRALHRLVPDVLMNAGRLEPNRLPRPDQLGIRQALAWRQCSSCVLCLSAPLSLS